MTINSNKWISADTVRKTRVDTTYEYTPILGQILGIWRKVDARRFGESIEIQIRTELRDYDRIVINGEEIEIPPRARESTNTNT